MSAMPSRTSFSPPLRSHRLSSALCLTLLRKSFRLLSCAASRFWTTGFGLAGLEANLNFGAGIGEDWISRRGNMFGSRGPSGGDDARIGDEDKGDGTAGRYMDELSPVKTGRGIIANISVVGGWMWEYDGKEVSMEPWVCYVMVRIGVALRRGSGLR